MMVDVPILRHIHGIGRQLDRLPENDTAVIAKQLLGPSDIAWFSPGNGIDGGGIRGSQQKPQKPVSVKKWKRFLAFWFFLLSWYLFRHWLLRAWLATVPRTQLSQESWKSTGLVSGPNETLSVVSQALTSAGGIDYMHSKSVMHRDIKAENVLLTEWSATAVATRLRFWWCAKWRAQDELDGVRTFEE